MDTEKFISPSNVKKLEKKYAGVHDFWGSESTSIPAMEAFVRDWWDGRKSFQSMKGTNGVSFYSLWRSTIGFDNRMFPLGSFKQYMELPRTEIYRKFCTIFANVPRGSTKSPKDLFMEEFPKIYELNTGYLPSREECMTVLSYRLWYGTKGICQESKVHDVLEEMAKRNGSEYYEGLESDESKDIDSFIKIRREDGTYVVKNVSIKNGYALSIKGLWEGYRSKGKTSPHIYVGYLHDNDSELTCIKASVIDDWGRKYGVNDRL